MVTCNRAHRHWHSSRALKVRGEGVASTEAAVSSLILSLHLSRRHALAVNVTGHGRLTCTATCGCSDHSEQGMGTMFWAAHAMLSWLIHEGLRGCAGCLADRDTDICIPVQHYRSLLHGINDSMHNAVWCDLGCSDSSMREVHQLHC